MVVSVLVAVLVLVLVAVLWHPLGPLLQQPLLPPPQQQQQHPRWQLRQERLLPRLPPLGACPPRVVGIPRDRPLDWGLVVAWPLNVGSPLVLWTRDGHPWTAVVVVVVVVVVLVVVAGTTSRGRHPHHLGPEQGVVAQLASAVRGCPAQHTVGKVWRMWAPWG